MADSALAQTSDPWSDTPFDTIVITALCKLAAASDEETGAAIDCAFSDLADSLKARSACLFVIPEAAEPVVLCQRGFAHSPETGLDAHRAAAVQTMPDRSGPTSGLRSIVVKAEAEAARLVLTYGQAVDAPPGDVISQRQVAAVLRGIAGTFFRNQHGGSNAIRDRSEIANSLDQGIGVYNQAGSLRFRNRSFASFFANHAEQIRSLAEAMQLFDSWATDRSLGQRPPAKTTSDGIELTVMQPEGRILRVQIRSLPSGASMLICTDVGELYTEKAHWEAAIDGAGIGTWELTVADGKNRVNERWANMIGYRLQDMEPQTLDSFKSLLSPESILVNRAAYEKILAGETDRFECELQMYHKNGHRIWVLSRGRVTAFDAEGMPAVLSGVHLEISELKLAEERLQQVVEGAQIGTWDWDIAAEVQRANHQWAVMLGYSEEEVSPMTYGRWRDLVHPDDIAMVEENMGRCLDGRADAMAAEYRMRHKNGEWCWMMDRAKVISRTRDGKAAYIVGIQIEIGQQKAREAALILAKTHAEQALSERNRAERRLADIAAVSEDWFWEQDSDLRFQFFSHMQFLNTVTGAKAQLLGRSWQEWLQDCAEERTGADWAALFKTLEARAPFRDFVMELTSDTEADPRWLRFSGTPVFDEHDGFVGYRGVGSDVTQLYLAKLRAEEASKSKSMFLANMSHEIRTPLNGVLGMAEVLETTVTEPRQQEMIRTIRDSGESLLNILNDILDMSKIEARKLELELVAFDPTELASRIEDLHRLRAEEKGLDFEISLGIGAERPRLGDPHRLRQILNNLISNAIKFTEKGRVSVILRGKPGRPLVIEIRDTGIGMSPEQVKNIHEEFVQADSSITRRYGGTGLGMSITRTLVEMMKGQISIASELGSGTRITVELPLPNAEIAEVVAPAPVEHLRSGVGLHFLIADDNATNRTVLCHLVRQSGAETTLVSNGLEALQAWRAGGFDLLLLDIAMPVMDGKTAIQSIRMEEKAGGLGYTPAIAVTANVMPFQISEYIAAGFDATIGKPVSSKHLAQTIGGLLGKADAALR